MEKMEEKAKEILERMDHAMAIAYEKRELGFGEGGLKWCIRDIEDANLKIKNIFRTQMVFVVLGLAAGFIGLVFKVKPLSGVGLTLGCLGAFIVAMISFQESQSTKLRKMRRGNEDLLEAFLRSVGKLELPELSMMGIDEYTLKSVRYSLAVLADNLSRAEKEFDAEHSSSLRSVRKIVYRGQREMACRRKLSDALKAAKKFGLTFNRRELF